MYLSYKQTTLWKILQSVNIKLLADDPSIGNFKDTIKYRHYLTHTLPSKGVTDLFLDTNPVAVITRVTQGEGVEAR